MSVKGRGGSRNRERKKLNCDKALLDAVGSSGATVGRESVLCVRLNGLPQLLDVACPGLP